MSAVETLAAFLAARYDEAEALAKAAEADWDAEHAMYEWNDLPDAAFAYARNLSPKHRLADIKLKRAILADVTRICEVSNDLGAYRLAWRTMRRLGTEFTEHAAYKQEWRPE